MPLYQQLAEQLARAIETGVYAAGERLPSEPAMARRLDIGRPTVRHATDVLVRRGLIERRRGSGTFVRARPRAVDLFSLSGTTAALNESGVELRTRIVKPVEWCASSRASESGQADTVESAERPSYSFTRLSLLAGKPLLLEEFELDALLFPEFDRFELERLSLARIAKEEYFLEPTGARQTFIVTTVDGERARWLRVAPTFPILAVQRQLEFGDIAVGVRVGLFCRTDQYAFSQTLGRMTS